MALTGMAVAADRGEAGLRVLSGKRILVISPQPWDHVPVSKHHYALELARENEVCFLEPPFDHGSARIEQRKETKNLTIVSWQPSFPRRLRFHAYALYRLLIAADARKIARRTGPLDIVWSFDFNLFPDLGAFGAGLRIFHPVDPLSSRRQADIGASADLVISVSERILSNFSGARFSGKTMLVNHALGEEFARLAAAPAPAANGARRRVGFMGNLDRGALDTGLLRRLAEAHRDIAFEFWGPYAQGGAFHAALAGLANVTLHGRRDKEQLAREIAGIDCFILPYIADPNESDRSNSHKLLEYMSTGRIIVASPMDCYADRPDLIRMAGADSDEAFLAAFADVMGNLDFHNAPERTGLRKAFAARHTYAGNVRRIDAWLADRMRAG